MSFRKLKDRIEKLPLVLAGPMVRRVEPASVTVWVALRRRRHIRLEVYDGASPHGLVGFGERKTVAVGANLHIACVTAKPQAPLAAFADGTTYLYDLFFDHDGAADNIQSGVGLSGPRIVSASDVAAVAADEARIKLTYAADGGPARPSFVMPPPSVGDLRLLHGSCRKELEKYSDALEAADHILREAFRGNDRRPHMLFLTGDNVYNDGCRRESFQVILDAAPVLLGWDEFMPGTGGPLSDMSELRWAYTFEEAGLSAPGASGRHLFGLGEFVALYLLSYGDVLWPEDLDYQRRTFDFRVHAATNTAGVRQSDDVHDF